jgi:hypothetical protein
VPTHSFVLRTLCITDHLCYEPSWSGFPIPALRRWMDKVHRSLCRITLTQSQKRAELAPFSQPREFGYLSRAHGKLLLGKEEEGEAEEEEGEGEGEEGDK